MKSAGVVLSRRKPMPFLLDRPDGVAYFQPHRSNKPCKVVVPIPINPRNGGNNAIRVEGFRTVVLKLSGSPKTINQANELLRKAQAEYELLHRNEVIIWTHAFFREEGRRTWEGVLGFTRPVEVVTGGVSTVWSPDIAQQAIYRDHAGRIIKRVTLF